MSINGINFQTDSKYIYANGKKLLTSENFTELVTNTSVDNFVQNRFDQIIASTQTGSTGATGPAGRDGINGINGIQGPTGYVDESVLTNIQNDMVDLQNNIFYVNTNLSNKIDNNLFYMNVTKTDLSINRIDSSLNTIFSQKDVEINKILNIDQTIYADREKGTVVSGTPYGWGFSNPNNNGSKINWYYFNKQTSGKSIKVNQLSNMYCVIKQLDGSVENPFFILYTTPTGTGDAASWYRTKLFYGSNDLPENVDKSKQILLYTGTDDQSVNPEIPPSNRQQLQLNSSLCNPTTITNSIVSNSTDEINLISLQTSSQQVSYNKYNFICSEMGLKSSLYDEKNICVTSILETSLNTYKSVLDLSVNRIDSSLNELKSYVDTSLNNNYYVKSYIDTSYSQLIIDVSNRIYKAFDDASGLIVKLVDNAPTALNTLNEIATFIEDISENDIFGKINPHLVSLDLSVNRIDSSLNTIFADKSVLDLSVNRIDSSLNTIFYDKSLLDLSVNRIDSSLNTIFSDKSVLDLSVNRIDSSLNTIFADKSVLDLSVNRIDSSLNTIFTDKSILDLSVNRIDSSLNTIFTDKLVLDLSVNRIDSSLNTVFYDKLVLDLSINRIDSSLNTIFTDKSVLDLSVNRIDSSLNTIFADKSVLDSSINRIDSSLNTIFADKSVLDFSINRIDSSLNTIFADKSILDLSVNRIDSSLNTIFSDKSILDLSVNRIDSSLNTIFSDKSVLDLSINRIDSSLNTIFADKSVLDLSVNRIDTSLNTIFADKSVLDLSVNRIDSSLNTIFADKSVLDLSVNRIDSSLNSLVNSIIPTLYSVVDSSFGLVESHLSTLDTSVNNIYLNQQIQIPIIKSGKIQISYTDVSNANPTAIAQNIDPYPYVKNCSINFNPYTITNPNPEIFLSSNVQLADLSNKRYAIPIISNQTLSNNNQQIDFSLNLIAPGGSGPVNDFNVSYLIIL